MTAWHWMAPVAACVAALAVTVAVVVASGPGPVRAGGPAADDESDFELGDRMDRLADRMAALWYAGRAGNHELAEYELHEIEELLEGVEEADLSEGDVPLNPPFDSLLAPRLAALDEAVDAAARGEDAGFEAAYRETVQACNACHVSVNHGYLRITTPTRPPRGNFSYEPE